MATMRMQHARLRGAPLPRLSLETAGILILLLGAWGAVVSFIGPAFGFSGDGASSWHWSLAHGLLFLAPGAVAFAMGILTFASILRGRAGRAMLDLAGLLVVVCGAWFVVGPLAWPVIEGASVFQTTVPLRELAYWIGYSLGPGGLLMALGAFILGRAKFQVPFGIDDDEPVRPAPVSTFPL